MAYYDDAPTSGRLGEMLAAVKKAANDWSNTEFEIKTLYAIKKWALEQQGVKVGDRVRIRDSYVLQERHPDGHYHGFWAYRECLAPGKTGVVKDVYFNSVWGHWAASVMMDEEWSVSDWNGEIRRYPVEDDRRHVFGIVPKHLEVIEREGEQEEPCEKCGRVA